MTASEVFADNVKIYAKANGITMADIETESGVSVGYLSRIKKRHTFIALDNAIKISDFLQLPLETLLDPEFGKKVKRVTIQRRIQELEAEKAQLLSELGGDGT